MSNALAASRALAALGDVDFNWVRSLESIWSDADATTGGPNEALVAALARDFVKDTAKADARPTGRVLFGPPGVGKTHLVGLLRRQVWQAGGLFVLLDVLGLTDFWRSAALSYLTSLMQEMPGGRRQFEAVLAGVARRFKVEQQVEEALGIPGIEPRRIVDLLVGGLMRNDPNNTLKHQDVFRALSLLRSKDTYTVSLAHSWLQGYDADEQARTALGFMRPPPAPVELVRGMAWIMSLAGPTLVAVDQIDGLISASSLAGHGDDFGAGPSLSEVLAGGLLQLHDVRVRGQTIVSSLLDSWQIITRDSVKAFQDRFGTPEPLKGLNQAAAVANLIAHRLAPAYRDADFTPPFPTWPFSEAAVASAAAVAMMPRTVLMRCDAFRRQCAERGEVVVCNSLVELVGTASPPSGSIDFDADLRARRATAAIDSLVHSGDDGEIGRLLRDAFDLYARQFEPDEAVDIVSKGDPAQKIPPLHGRLTFTYHAENDRERHFCFRALEHGHAISFQARLRAALTASGISSRIADRYLLIVRRGPIPSGIKTKQLFDTFAKAGGVIINPSDDDLRTLVALRAMRDDAPAQGRQDGFEAWLKRSQPLLATAFFRDAGLSPPPATGKSAAATPAEPVQTGAVPGASPPPAAATAATVSAPPPDVATRLATAPEPVRPDAIPLGFRMAVGDEEVLLPLRLLQRHTAIIAGSGSGKTVLLRRLVEEAALAGIPAIVIDPNNDLSRLGDPWPERPAAFTATDDAKARRYRETVEVVVWTPGLRGGNPLALPVLPDFASLGDDRDERQQAVDMAAEALGPLAGAKTALQRGVLADALRHFASRGGGDLSGFTALLADLPDGLSRIGTAGKLAAAMADQLHAAVATNPLLKPGDAVLDPGRLFHGPDPARTRVSVINLSGLASDAAREEFVNRLQMTLFGWIKKHPSPTGRLYVMDEAQTFLPSQKPALSLGSGLRLVAQARKYGLGLVVATQVPRGIHNQVVSNCITQFFGRQSAPATIQAAQEIIAASGGAAPDIGRLKAGEFYFATEGSGKPAKLRTLLCLSHHPPNPPTPDEVAARAQKSAAEARL